MSDADAKHPNPKYAWRELPASGLPRRSATERAADFLEIYGPYDEETAREQASRCIQCPNPTCVSGCPLCNPIPQWMQLTAEGRFLEAAAVLGSSGSMAEICARLCPADHLCEHTCILDGISEPVSIRGIEQFLIEYAFAHGQIEAATPPPNGRRVAVAGSGAGGLACADALAKRGYAVAIFDSSMVPGGLLVNGTPAFRVEESVIQRRVDLLKHRGVKFNLGAPLWNKVALDQLRKDFDAVYLAMDARKARSLDIPGTDLPGVVQALPFLLQKKTAVPLHLDPIPVSGKRVCVIGAGDTAVDCLRAAIRWGARETLCLYRRGEADMPCGRNEYRNAVEEGARFMFHLLPVAVLGNGTGRVRGLRVAPTNEGAAAEAEIEADLVILALGFDLDPHSSSKALADVARDPSGRVIVNDLQMTSVPGVFAGGDLVHGPRMLLEVVRDARNAASHIDAFLSARR
jgi:glutamate synthase (NADPH/NADH) small chain